ncbi:MAG: SIMPL domain-containing protein [Ignavibacteriae bacterium]|nr:MAG: SIMPL domain-containing protein [Ignavibacteriota bacterium]
MNDNNRGILIPFAVILALGFIIGAVIIGNTWKNVSRGNVTITVTGSAQKEIRSDLATWNATFSNEGGDMQETYAMLQISNNKVKDYLVSKGFPADKLVFSSINTTVLHPKNAQGYATDEVSGYRLSQDVSLESNDVDKVDLLSREVTELINQDVEISSNPPQFFYTKLSDLKVEMIGLASKDAKTRAEQIANSTDNEIGEVRSSRMGVIQINAKNSTDISDYGMNDVSSLDKTITAVVSVSFSIE